MREKDMVPYHAYFKKLPPFPNILDAVSNNKFYIKKYYLFKINFLYFKIIFIV
jgi:hypothetical protein